MKQQQKQQALPEFTVDAEGHGLAHVALANSSQRATLYAEDYRRLMDAGFSRHWQYTEDGRGGAYVTLSAFTAAGKDRLVPVARLLVGAGHGQRVRASDGNTRNLRTENLSLYQGAAWYDAADWYPTADAARAASGKVATARRKRPKRSARTPGMASEGPSAPSAPYTPRVIDRAAMSARVKAMQANTEGSL